MPELPLLRDVELRDAELGDAEAIAAIYAPIVRSTATSFEIEPPDAAEMRHRIERVRATHPWIVCELDGALCGYAYASAFRARPAYSRTAETTVYVDRDHRRRGVARRLMTDLLGRLTEGGFHRVVAGVTLPNEPSVRLHEALGFTHVGAFREVGRKFGAWHDVGFWELALPCSP